MNLQEIKHKKVHEPGSASFGGVFSYILNKWLGWFRYENKQFDIYYLVIEDERIDQDENNFSGIGNSEYILISRAVHLSEPLSLVTLFSPRNQPS